MAIRSRRAGRGADGTVDPLAGDPAGATSEALWLLSPKGRFEVRPVARPAAGPGQVVVRVRAVAVNPVDAITGPVRRIVYPWVRYPTVIGSDVAGEVVEVGEQVTRLSPATACWASRPARSGLATPRPKAASSGTLVVLERVCTPIPDDVAFENAAVLPLGIATAAAGLFEPDQLGLPCPGAVSEPRHEVVLVWGASTSVGCNAVQLARASGYTVLATAGIKNYEFVRSLGAEAVFDYRAADVDEKILAALGARPLAGTIAIGRGSLTHALRIARRSGGTKRIASAYPDPVTKVRALIARTRGVRISSIWGGTPVQSSVGPALFQDFLPGALQDGRFRTAPDPLVAGSGLQAVPGALSTLRAGVSATKLVVTVD